MSLCSEFQDAMWLFDTDNTRLISRIKIDEAVLLWTCLQATTGTVVEIGSLFGGTTTLMLMGMEKGRKLYSIDIKPRHDPKVLEYLNEAKESGRFEMVVGDSGKTSIDETIDLLFVDGDHSYAGVTRDIECHWNNVRDHGLVLFHDAALSKGGKPPYFCEGVKRATDELVVKRVAKRLKVVRSMVLLEKVSNLNKEQNDGQA